jgi:acyl carrier protein
MSASLEERLKHLIVEVLRLEDVTPADLSDDEPLFGTKLQLDSIDALELVVRLEKDFGIKIASSEESREALGSVATLAAFIRRRAPASHRQSLG